MGNNKKARSKNRKNGKPKTLQRSVKSIPASKIFHPDDDLEGLLKHIHAREFGYQKLAKYIPVSLQQFKLKKITSKEFVGSIVNTYKRSYFPLLNDDAVNSRMCHRFAEKALQFSPDYKDLLNEDEVLKFSRYMKFLISNKAVSEHITKSAETDDAVDSTKTEEVDLAGDSDGADVAGDNKNDKIWDDGNKLDYLTNPEHYRIPRSAQADMVTAEFKSAIDSTCKAWASRMDGLICNGSQEGGTFLSRCPVYARTIAELSEIGRSIMEETTSGREALAVDELIRWGVCFQQEIRLGIHDVKKSCWECGKVCQTCMFACGCCETATYCGERCFKQAWETGHSKACKGLRAKRQFMEDTILLIDEKHKELTDSSSGTPPAMCDYAMLPSLIDDTDIELSLSAKSMSNFYSNLERVRRGEFWVVDQAPKVEVYMSRLRQLGISGSDTELSQFFCLAAIMATDWTAQSETAEVALRCEIRDSLDKSDGICMPAARFLQLYNNEQCCSWGFPVGGSGWKQARRFLIKNSLASLRAKCHKNTGSDSVNAVETIPKPITPEPTAKTIATSRSHSSSEDNIALDCAADHQHKVNTTGWEANCGPLDRNQIVSLSLTP